MSGGEDGYELRPVGSIDRKKGKTYIKIHNDYVLALKQLEHFSHVIVFWWADENDNEEARNTTITKPSYAKKKIVGVFATRAEYRPNPIGMTTV